MEKEGKDRAVNKVLYVAILKLQPRFKFLIVEILIRWHTKTWCFVLEGFFKAIFSTSLVGIDLKFNNSDGVLKDFTFHRVKCREERKSG